MLFPDATHHHWGIEAPCHGSTFPRLEALTISAAALCIFAYIYFHTLFYLCFLWPLFSTESEGGQWMVLRKVKRPVCTSIWHSFLNINLFTKRLYSPVYQQCVTPLMDACNFNLVAFPYKYPRRSSSLLIAFIIINILRTLPSLHHASILIFSAVNII